MGGDGPGHHQSGGTRRGGRTTQASQWLRTTRIQVAWAAVGPQGTIFAARCRTLAKRPGTKQAPVAVGDEILTVIAAILEDQTDHREQGTPEVARSPERQTG